MGRLRTLKGDISSTDIRANARLCGVKISKAPLRIIFTDQPRDRYRIKVGITKVLCTVGVGAALL